MGPGQFDGFASSGLYGWLLEDISNEAMSSVRRRSAKEY